MPEKFDLAPGVMVGAYRLTERIGKGGFSEVWSGWDTHLNRLVAVKIIPRIGMDAHNTIQFGREAAMVTRLEHPHILPLYDFGETPDYRYLVMRYVTGGSLAQRIEHKPLPVSEIIRLMTPIASTLDYIHEQRVVHRDLKPGNILLDAQDLPYLTDFGLAKELTDETRPMHSASGTLTYMPPEQFSGGAMSTQSDQYSFGILLFQLFTGQLPYEGKVALGMRQISTQERMADVRELNPQLPDRLNEFLWQLTDPDSTKRPTSASAVMKEITDLLRGVDSAAEPVTQGITYALESGAYRQREAETLIEQNLSYWQKGVFSLSLTHFVLLDIILRDLTALATGEVRSLMLRGALEYNQQVEQWWKLANDAERQRACWHAIAHGNDEIAQRALALAVDTAWVRNASEELINRVGKRLMPLTDYTPVALAFLEHTLPSRDDWDSDDTHLVETDNALATLATSKSALANRAAMLIGKCHRTRAMSALPTLVGQANPILTAYEAAGSLPGNLLLVERIRLTLFLALRQLLSNPLQALGRYGWAALGNALGVGIMIYITYSMSDIANIRSTHTTLNSIGLGLLFGMLYGAGVWLARHISYRLQVAPLWLRIVLATLAGGFVIAFGFNFFQQYVYEDLPLETSVVLTSGMLYVLGFAMSVMLPPLLQVLAGAAGIICAYMIPWTNYLATEYEVRPPFIFEESHPDIPLIITLFCGLVIAFFTLGYVWREVIERELIKRSDTLQHGSIKKSSALERASS